MSDDAPFELIPPVERATPEERRAALEWLDYIDLRAKMAEKVLAENEKFNVENDRLVGENLRLLAEHAEFLVRRQEDEAYIALAEELNAELERRLRESEEARTSDHAVTLTAIAIKHPEFPQLFRLAEEMREKQGQRKWLMEVIKERLPQEFHWANDEGRIVYQRPFLDALTDLQKGEQEQVIERLFAFATHGSVYPSLHTNKPPKRLRYSPRGCFVSRGAADLRFTWQKSGIIVIYWLYRKSDTTVGDSER